MIVTLADKKKEQNQELIQHLEEALELAREGKIQNFIGAYTDDQLGFFTILSYERFLTALGLAEAIKMDIVQDAQEE